MAEHGDPQLDAIPAVRGGAGPVAAGRTDAGVPGADTDVWRLARRNPGFVVGFLLVALYVLLRTAAVPEALLIGWTAAAALGTLASPVLGLTVLAAIGPFTEAQTAEGDVTAAPVLLAALAGGVAARVAIARRLPPLSVPIALGAVLLVGTAVGVVNAARTAGIDAGLEAARLWVPGMGGAMTMLLAAAWAGWRSNIGPVLVVMASVALAGVLSLADVLSAGQIRRGLLGWLLRSDTVLERLGGIIPAPNAAAAILLVASALAVSALLFSRRRDLRLMAVAALVPLAIAIVLTYSRSALLGLTAVGALLAWRFRRRAGVAFLAVGLVAAIVLAQGYLAARTADTVGAPAIGTTGDLLRVRAWSAAVRMWLAEPIVGHGFRSFEWQHAAYGEPEQDAPHNEWLRLFAEEGAVVGLAGLAFALSTIVVLMRAPGWIPVGAAAAAAGLFVMASFNNPFLYTQVNVPAFLVIGTGLGLALRGPPARRSPPVRQPAPQTRVPYPSETTGHP